MPKFSKCKATQFIAVARIKLAYSDIVSPNVRVHGAHFVTAKPMRSARKLDRVSIIETSKVGFI